MSWKKKAIGSLKQRNNIIIKEADKDSTVFIMDNLFYLCEVECILNDVNAYLVVNAGEYAHLIISICRLVKKFNSENNREWN